MNFLFYADDSESFSTKGFLIHKVEVALMCTYMHKYTYVKIILKNLKGEGDGLTGKLMYYSSRGPRLTNSVWLSTSGSSPPPVSPAPMTGMQWEWGEVGGSVVDTGDDLEM